MNQVVRVPLTVRRLDVSREAAWDAFVDACPEATFFHRAGWRRVIGDTLGHSCHFLMAESAGTVRGVLPLVHVKSAFFGNSLISNAFCVYGGPACADRTARDALDAAALDLGRTLGIDHLEYRLIDRQHPDWACKDSLYVTFRKALDPDPDKNLSVVRRKQRAQVRKGIKNGLVSEVDATVDRFFNMYSISVRNLGTPVLPRRYYAAVKAEFGEDCEILTICHEQQAISSVMNFYFRNEILPYYGGGSAAARDLAANDFMYWEAMRRAAERGLGVFDFGRSKVGTGSFDFKRHWGFEPQPLHYEYKLLRGREVPDVNPLNPKYRRAIAIWKRLPISVANTLGPILARRLG